MAAPSPSSAAKRRRTTDDERTYAAGEIPARVLSLLAAR